MGILKQDFTNVLQREIDKLVLELSLIEKEIEVRKERTSMTALESVQNEKAILYLEKEIVSKTDYLEKLKEKRMFDKAELDEDYVDAMNNIQEYFDMCEQVENKHHIAQLEYISKELELYMEEENKEAVVFYFRSIKEALQDAGVEIK